MSILRNALDMYQTEHGGSYPAPSGSVTVEDLLLKYSTVDGSTVSATKDTTNNIIYGPYLRSVPPIPVGANKGSIGISHTATSGATAAGGAGVAWLYNSADGVIQANATGADSAGKAYSSY
jgi:hypothetical protein